MLKRIEGFWMSIIAPGVFVQRFTLDPLPRGTNVYASICLSEVNTMATESDPNAKFIATAAVESWTFYRPDGTKSYPPSSGMAIQNAIAVENCATITFALVGWRVAATAQINLMFF
jgi:hypothetical protein